MSFNGICFILLKNYKDISMSLLPSDAKQLQLEGATVDFYEYIEDGLSHFYFDTSECGPPEPMVNAMVGLQLLKDNTQQLVMINHKPPGGLFPKIEQNYSYNISDLDNGKVKVVFTFKEGTVQSTDFASNKCSG
jgi:hypothetical protein